MSAPQLKLTYFDMPGRAELARLLFAYGGIAFEDNRVPMQDFGAMKPTLPLGQLPILEVDGVVFSQSMALARCAAKLAGLYPEDPVQALHTEVASETCVDLLNVVVGIFQTPDEATKAEKMTKFLTEMLPQSFSALERRVRGKFFAGDNITFADVQLFDLIETMLKANLPDVSTAAYPKLEALIEGVKVNTKIAAYLAK